MMFRPTTYLAGLLPAATLAIALGCPVPALAGDADTVPHLAMNGAHAAHMTVDDVEDRIESLHRRLKITDDQAVVWNNFSKVMRDNGNQIRTVIANRKQKSKVMNAVDDLRSYQEMADAHVDGLNKLIPAFAALYATMSDEQKRNADVVFGESRRHAAQ